MQVDYFMPHIITTKLRSFKKQEKVSFLIILRIKLIEHKFTKFLKIHTKMEFNDLVF